MHSELMTKFYNKKINPFPSPLFLSQLECLLTDSTVHGIFSVFKICIAQ